MPAIADLILILPPTVSSAAQGRFGIQMGLPTILLCTGLVSLPAPAVPCSNPFKMQMR